MSDEEYRAVTGQIIDLGVIEAVVTGGEPCCGRTSRWRRWPASATRAWGSR